MTAISIISSINRPPVPLALLFIPFLLACFALSQTAVAVCEEGCSGDNTFLGEGALANSTGFGNTAVGYIALASNTSGFDNTAGGYHALTNNTSGGGNTALGALSLNYNTIGSSNTAVGLFAMLGNLSGSNNTALGASALGANTTASGNTAIGFEAVNHNTTGADNTGVGDTALASNTTGSFNTANGVEALFSNTTGDSNTATGNDALFSNTTGFDNTANGVSALYSNTTGLGNTASGDAVLVSNTTGSFDTATGVDALQSNTTGSNNTASGYLALASNTTGSSNIALGVSAGANVTTGSNNIDIGNAGVAGDFARIRIGTRPTHKNTFIAGIFGVTVPTGVAVLIDNSGHLGTTTSSARFKEAIKPMDKASEAILSLKPVTFHYKQELDPEGIPQFGLVAEEVEKVNPDLVARDDEGKPHTVRYEAVNAMLLNEFLKEHRKVERLEKQVAALTAGFQKVSAQLELNKFATGRIRRYGSAPPTALNNQ